MAYNRNNDNKDLPIVLILLSIISIIGIVYMLFKNKKEETLDDDNEKTPNHNPKDFI